jgi:uncharacterized protein YjiS (DUF1127 family)
MTTPDRDLDGPIAGFPAPATLAASCDGAISALSLVGLRPEASLAWRLWRSFARIAAVAFVRHERARARRALLQPSDHMLRDIGIARAEAPGEAGKPFWHI